MGIMDPFEALTGFPLKNINSIVTNFMVRLENEYQEDKLPLLNAADNSQNVEYE